MKSTEIERLLPSVYRRTAVDGSALAAILSVMEGMHAPSEEVLRDLPAYFNPLGCPDQFLPLLAVWVGLGHLLDAHGRWPGDESRLRLVIANAAELTRRRGTAAGLTMFLTLATGRKGFAVDDSPIDREGRDRPFHLRIETPVSDAREIALVRSIVESEKPAYTTYELVFPESV